MHPVQYLFKDIYRDHWGIPLDERPSRNRRDAPGLAACAAGPQRAPQEVGRSPGLPARAEVGRAALRRGRTGKLSVESAELFRPLMILRER